MPLKLVTRVASRLSPGPRLADALSGADDSTIERKDPGPLYKLHSGTLSVLLGFLHSYSWVARGSALSYLI
jgi:hypothetical protein